MSIYYSMDGGEPDDLASNTGWGDLCRWVDALDDAPELKHLTVYGWSQDLPAVAENLRSALSGNVEASVKSTAENLLGILRGCGHDEVMTINNGIVAAVPAHVAEGARGNHPFFPRRRPRE